MKTVKARGRVVCSARLGLWCAALAWGCGARTLSSDSTSSGNTDGTATDDGQVPTHTEDTGATSSPPTNTSTGSPTSSADETTSSASTETLDTSPIPGTWEGVVLELWGPTCMNVCGFGDVCFPSASCGNLYVRAVGTMRWIEPGGIGCSGWTLDIEELLEARACEPSDCDDSCTGPVSCSWECDATLQDCPGPNDKCAVRANDGPVGFHARVCVPLPAEPVAEGEACTVAAATDEGYDDCDRGLHCWAEDPEASTGVCVPFCFPNWPESCATDCLQCTFGSEGLCLADCPGCDLSHSC